MVLPLLGTILINLLIGVALSLASTLIQQAFHHDQQSGRKIAGVRGTIQTGGDEPLAFIVGHYGTAGHLEYAGTWGNVGETPNAYYTKVISVSDLPVRSLSGLYVNGERVTIGGVANGNFGFPITEYTVDGTQHLWVKFYDGTQTTADPLLLSAFGSDPNRPWSSDMIGRGVAYAVVTALVNRELFTGLPNYLFEINGIELDDPRGDNAHDNPIVAVNNILRGLSYNGTWVYGLQNLSTSRLPSSNWEAQMDKCDASVPTSTGTETQFRFGLEVTVDAEPRAIIGEILKACNGRIAEIGGVYKILVGEPGSPVVSLTDEDVTITAEQTFEPFPGLEATYNAISATYPEPEESWENKEAPPRYRSDLEALDDDRRLPFSTSYKAVPYPTQVQRLMRAAIEETRRFRRHSFTAPPEWWEYEPLDVAEWTSDRNGYTDKQFLITAMDDLPNGNQVVAMQEIDPADYDWDSDFELPWDVAPLVVARPAAQPMTGWSVAPHIHTDAASRSRRPGIEVEFAGGLVDVRAVRVQIRRDGETDPFFDGEYPYDPTVASPLIYIVANAILGAQDYEARGKFIPFSGRETDWSAWLAVTTPDVNVEFEDLGAQLRDLQVWTSVNVRQLMQDVQLLSAIGEEQDRERFTQVQQVRREYSLGDERVTAAYTEAILLATGPDSALADSITQVEATVDDVSAFGTWRMTVQVAPTGYESRVGAEARGGTEGDWRSAAWYLDVSSTPSVPTRFVMVAGQTAILDDDGNVLALFDGSGEIDYARIPVLSSDKIEAGAIIAGKLSAGAIDTSSILIDGVLITSKYLANSIVVTGFSTASPGSVTGFGTSTSVTAGVTITPNGGRVLVTASVTVENNSGGSNDFNFYMSIRKAGVQQIETRVATILAAKAGNGTLSWVDTSPGTSAVTYEVGIRETHSASVTPNHVFSSIKVENHKNA